ncbi:hypothetical protein GCM10022226_61650 [Sphaerisporangium flaviroseum]|uniref:Uncharacterized protein n=1 Tax=Sphaerisporangium flaviroseum TaxID=509199 RepID=A0ABP7J182_9ACTN
MIGQYRQATNIDPNWYIHIQDPDTRDFGWYKVTMVAQTVTDVGEERLHFFTDGPSAVATKDDHIMSRTPEEATSAASTP